MATAVRFGNVENPAPAKKLTRTEANALFDSRARLYLGISGTDFLRRWDAGEYRDRTACTSRVMRVACMISFVRRPRARKKSSNRAR
jgi:hypothetical protein